jgi:hypothetical protein
MSRDYTGGESGSETVTAVYTNEMSEGDMLAEADGRLGELEWNSSSGVLASTAITIDSSLNRIISKKIGRYRFKIDSTHTGSVFHLEWDEVTFPESGEPSLSPKSFDWSGPGNKEDPDDDSWFTPWSADVEAEKDETVEIRNLRFTCYSSPYGSKPQFTGETYPEE